MHAASLLPIFKMAAFIVGFWPALEADLIRIGDYLEAEILSVSNILSLVKRRKGRILEFPLKWAR